MTLDTANAPSRLAGPANAANGTSTIFTGTASHIYTIRGIRIVNTTAASITAKIGIGGVTDALLIVPATPIAPGAAWDDDGLFILSGAETLQINTTATGLTVTVCGLDQS